MFPPCRSQPSRSSAPTWMRLPSTSCCEASLQQLNWESVLPTVGTLSNVTQVQMPSLALPLGTSAGEVQLEQSIPFPFQYICYAANQTWSLSVFVPACITVLSVRVGQASCKTPYSARHVALRCKPAECIDRDPGKRQSVLYTDSPPRISITAVPLIRFPFVEARLADRWYSHRAAEAEAADNSGNKSDHGTMRETAG